MPTKHTVQEGECVSSIAYDYGLFPNTVWEYEENSKLRELRKNPNVLLPGDILVIPDKKEKQVEAETGERHRFRRKGVPEKLELHLLDYGAPRASLRYRVDIDGKVITGTTDEEGRLEHWISPGAMRGKMIFKGETEEEQEEYELLLGALPPIDTDLGVEIRLKNLGFMDEEEESSGPEDDELVQEAIGLGLLEEGEEDDREIALREAISSFQLYCGLPVTGEADEDTRQKLVEIHKS